MNSSDIAELHEVMRLWNNTVLGGSERIGLQTVRQHLKDYCATGEGTKLGTYSAHIARLLDPPTNPDRFTDMFAPPVYDIDALRAKMILAGFNMNGYE